MNGGSRGGHIDIGHHPVFAIHLRFRFISVPGLFIIDCKRNVLEKSTIESAKVTVPSEVLFRC